MGSSVTPHASSHAAALAAIEAGRPEEGREALLTLVREALDATHLNDLAVASQMTNRLDDADALLRAARVVAGPHPDLDANLALLAELRAQRARAWRAADPGGPDPRMPERAFPGMPGHSTMGEHCVRYAFALGALGGQDVLDLGCGTGYGAEMLTWAAERVRGFDLWEPEPEQRPVWPGGAELTYGHDLCTDPLPAADAATMFEVLEHLPDAPAALRLVWRAVHTLVASFPNPTYHGSHLNPWHVTDWTLDQLDGHLRATAATRYADLRIEHFHQPNGTSLLAPGRDPEAAFWVVVARAS